MNLLSNIITYVRRIVKTPSNASLSDDLIIDYINRFWTMDVDARMQLFDLKTKYQFMTQPTVDQYNMPLYSVQTEPLGQIYMYPVYQGFLGPAYINGIPVGFQTQQAPFWNIWPKVTQQVPQAAIGDGGQTYNIRLPIGNYQGSPANPPLNGILRGHVDIAGIVATGVNIDPPVGATLNTKVPLTSVDSAVFISAIASDGSTINVRDSGQFLEGNVNYGLLMATGPNGNSDGSCIPLDPQYSTTQNTINYLTGEINVTFPQPIPPGNAINVTCYFFQTGLPRAILFYNNSLIIRSPPDTQYLVELDAYLSPAAFFDSSKAFPYAYMCEYIARGAARKILSDTGDQDQFAFYEPLFKEQELLVWKRSQRQFTSTRTETIYSQGLYTSYGHGSTSGTNT